MTNRLAEVNRGIAKFEEIKKQADKEKNMSQKAYSCMIKDLRGLRALKSTLIYSA